MTGQWDGGETADAAVRCAVAFLPAQPPRAGKIGLWRPDGGPLPDAGSTGSAAGTPQVGGGAEPARLTVARRHGNGARSRTVPALLLPLAEAVPLLLRARHDPAADPAAACWGAATHHALHLAARGRLLPGLTADDTDAWRAGPLDPEDIAHLRAIAAAMPAEAYPVPLTGSRPLRLHDPAALVRLYVDAVVDALPRTPAAGLVAGAPFAATGPQRLPGAREWAAEVAAGVDAGVRLSLRLDLAPHQLFDSREEHRAGEADERRAAAAVLQVHSLTDPTLVTDASALWEGEGSDHFGPRSRVDTLLALRRAARVWGPLTRLLDRPVPDVLPLGEDELYELLGEAAPRLGAAGVAVHWPKELARGLTASAVLRPAPGSAADGFGFFDTRELLQFRWQVAMDGAPLTEAEMDALAEAHRPVVRLRDQWVLVDPGLVRKARKRELGYLEPVDALAATLNGTAEVDGEQVEVVPSGRSPRCAPGSPRKRPRYPSPRDCARRSATTNCVAWPGSTP